PQPAATCFAGSVGGNSGHKAGTAALASLAHHHADPGKRILDWPGPGLDGAASAQRVYRKQSQQFIFLFVNRHPRRAPRRGNRGPTLCRADTSVLSPAGTQVPGGGRDLVVLALHGCPVDLHSRAALLRAVSSSAV